MTSDFKVVNEKLEQAVAILQEQNVDAWLVFARETTLTPDPCVDMVAGMDFTWHSAFLIARTGARIAIVGRFDAENVRAIGGYTEVIPYDESFRPALKDAVTRLDPTSIALDYSENDPAADGLTHGMYLELLRTFEGTAYADCFVSAEAVVGSLRGRKSPTEIERIREAIRTTEKLYADLGASLAIGQTESEIAARLTKARKALGLGTSWGEDYCPIVNAGPEFGGGPQRAGGVEGAARPPVAS